MWLSADALVGEVFEVIISRGGCLWGWFYSSGWSTEVLDAGVRRFSPRHVCLPLNLANGWVQGTNLLEEDSCLEKPWGCTAEQILISAWQQFQVKDRLWSPTTRATLTRYAAQSRPPGFRVTSVLQRSSRSGMSWHQQWSVGCFAECKRPVNLPSYADAAHRTSVCIKDYTGLE